MSKQKIIRTIGNLALSPFSWFNSRSVSNVVYLKGLQLVVDASVPYAEDVPAENKRNSSKYFRPAEAFDRRFQEIKKASAEVNAQNLLDIGCAEGYMIGRAARELGLFAVGLEMDRQRIRVGNAQSELNNDMNYGIIPSSAEPGLLDKVPVFDLVVCFSVLHHVIRHHGYESGINFLKSIKSRTRFRFLFDMGSPDETDNDPEWGNVLAFLKGDIVAKNKEMLESAGFVDVTHVGDTPGYIKSAKRPLFVCSS
jgi:cyclopropane fatty-acyl-phospholipid synthase-like methyltransferase